MKYIVGLGNKDEKFKQTRHNVGFMFVDWLAENQQLSFANHKKISAQIAKGDGVVLCKPQTYMNLSGQAVRGMIDFFENTPVPSEIKNLVVVHDDLDIELGSYKIQFGVGPKQHNGLLSLYEHLGTDQFWHVRVGIEHRGELRSQIPGDQYVLQSFGSDEIETVGQLFPKMWQELLTEADGL